MQNMRDMWARGRGKAGLGAKKGEANSGAKLTEGAVRIIRSSNETIAKLASDLGVSTSLIYQVRTRRIWKHVP
jgi:hypothetical protein